MRQQKAKIRLLIVDQHRLVAEGLSSLLRKTKTIEIVGMAASIAEAITLLRAETPDITLLELDLGGEQGETLLKLLLNESLRTRVLILTGVMFRDRQIEAIRLGASGVVTKDVAGEVLLKAIEKVAQGELWLERNMVALMIDHLSGHARPTRYERSQIAIQSLTERERQIVELVCLGRKNNEIARDLYLSESTVRHHLSTIYRKLGVNDRVNLVIFAYENGLIPP